jgi:nuclear transport factor 2 (NTF2) superfamily protein
MKGLWCYQGNRISVRFEYESRDEDGQWWLRHSHHRFATRLRVSAAPGRESEVELALL